MIPWEHDCKTCLYNTEPKAKACEECRLGFMADITDRDEFMRGVQNAYQHALEKAGTHFKDIVQVVRCKDCKHRGVEGECPVLLSESAYLTGEESYFFCAWGEWGERREDG